MKQDALKKIIKQAVKEAIQEEIKDIHNKLNNGGMSRNSA